MPSPDVLKCWRGRDLKSPEWQQTAIASIASCMSKDYPHVSHQYDVWHLSKWVVKKLTNKAKQEGCKELPPWIQTISNHLWWSAATCDGSVQMLWEKWKSVLDHASNRHKWSGNSLFHQCCHRCISSSEAKKISWIKPGTPAHFDSLVGSGSERSC